MTTTIPDLETQIEQWVLNHIAATRDAVTAAVERAFVSSEKAPRRSPKPHRVNKTTASVGHRASEEIAALTERLYEAVRANPGETMKVLASQLGTSPRALSLPAAKLKGAGRVRVVGQRQFTRYFPLVNGAAKNAVT